MPRRLDLRPEPAEPGEETVYDALGVGHRSLCREPAARRSATRDAGWLLREAPDDDCIQPANAARGAGVTWDGTVLPCHEPRKHH